jgi:ribokinase
LAKLVNLGSACIDHVYRVPALARPGETVSSLSHQTFPGGKGLNQSLAAARAGADVHHFGCIGGDGELLREVLQHAGVDVTGLRTLEAGASGHAVIQVSEQGENAIVIAGGANRRIDEQDRDAVRDCLAPGDWLLLQNEINDLPAALDLARDCGARTAFNLAPVDGREVAYELGAVDLLIVNEIEARALVPHSIAARDHAAVAGWLADTHPGMTVVLTAGAGGLIHAEGGRVQSIPAFVVEAVDETAAGDAFIGYLLAGLLTGMPMHEALRCGSAAGALAVTRAGAASAIPARNEVLAMLG